MAYSTGTFTTPTQLLDAIRSFASSNGWTEDDYATDGTGKKLLIHKGTVYLGFRSLTAEATTASGGWSVNTATGVACSIATGYSSGSAWNAQPGAIANSTSKVCVGTFNHGSSGTYHLFASASPDMLFCVAEVQPGVFNHLGAGMLEKAGSYTGGEWLTGSYALDGQIYTTGGNTNYIDVGSSSHHLRPLPFLECNTSMSDAAGSLVRAEYSPYTGFGILDRQTTQPSWLSGSLVTSLIRASGSNNYQNSNLGNLFQFRSPAALNGVSPMIPFYLFGKQPSGMASPLGYAPHLRAINVQNYAPGDVITLGSETWKVFPGYQKDATKYTYYYGYAVRYEP